MVGCEANFIDKTGEALAVSNSLAAHSLILQQLLKLYFAERYMGMSEIAVLAKPGCEDFSKVYSDCIIAIALLDNLAA